MLGPVAYAIAASDLRPVNKRNVMLKYADDSYLIVPADNYNTCEAEIANIEAWSKCNNLKLNRSKCVEIVFMRSNSAVTALPPPLPLVARVNELKILGVTLGSRLTVHSHIEATLISCAQTLHALRTLRAHSLPDALIYKAFHAIILAKITYCSPAWRGYLQADDIARMEAFLRKAIKYNYCPLTSLPLSDMLDKLDTKLFHSIVSNPNHVLHPQLPPKADHKYNLRPRPHNLSLPTKTSALNARGFITRMIYKDSY